MAVFNKCFDFQFVYVVDKKIVSLVNNGFVVAVIVFVVFWYCTVKLQLP